jgi:hypothetical protein
MAPVVGQANDVPPSAISPPNASGAFELAKQYLEDKIGVWDWNDDVEFLGLSWVKFE